MHPVDVNVVGSGPNGLAAAVTMARAGLAVRVYEGAPTVGGGTRSAELTLPGFLHDVCSAVHPQALASPFFAAFELDKRIGFVIPDVSYAHPLDGGRAGIAYRDVDRTVAGLGRDGPAWRRLMGPLIDRLDAIVELADGPLLRIPRNPSATLLLGLRTLEQGLPAWNARFTEDVAPALLTGVMAHASARLPSLSAAGAGLVLALQGHGAGWGIPLGGSQSIADAMAADILDHGGEIVTDHPVGALRDLPPARATLLDTSPRVLAEWPDVDLPAAYRRRLLRYRYGSAVAKVDFAVSAPVPWRNESVRQAGTIHLGGTRRELAAAEHAVHAGRHAEHPFVLVSQPSLFDASRAPSGHHVVWAYAHVPSGSTQDATETVTAQIERYAPGFRDTIEATASKSALEQSQYNPNAIGGDISGGAVTIAQLVARPVLSAHPWRTPVDGLFLCSSSTPPGPAVHGMNGWFAARSALAERFGIRSAPHLGVRRP